MAVELKLSVTAVGYLRFSLPLRSRLLRKEDSVYRVILWDIDGTLLDFLAAEKAAIRSLFAEFELGECTDAMIAQYSAINKAYWEKLERGEMTKPQILVERFRDFFGKNGLDVTKAEAFNDRYQVCLGDTIVFKDDSKSIVERLKGQVLQYAVSNGTIIAQTKKLKASGLDQVFDGVFLSEQIGYEKPSTQFFEPVLMTVREKLPDIAEGEEILLVGDSLTSDMLGGNAAGIKTCWYNPEHTDRGNYDVTVDYEIDDLHQIYNIIKSI